MGILERLDGSTTRSVILNPSGSQPTDHGFAVSIAAGVIGSPSVYQVNPSPEMAGSSNSSAMFAGNLISV